MLRKKLDENKILSDYLVRNTIWKTKRRMHLLCSLSFFPSQKDLFLYGGIFSVVKIDNKYK